MVFPVVIYRGESWTIKKVEHWRIDAFELWCWKRLLSPLDSKEIKPVNPKRNRPWMFMKDWSRSSNTLATRYKEPTHWKRPWCWKRLKAGGEGDDRGWDGWMASPTQRTWVWVDSGSWWWTGGLACCSSWGPKSRTRLSNWTELNWTELNRTKTSWHKITNANSYGSWPGWEVSVSVFHNNIIPK